MLLQILAHTPAWVFALFALLLWMGITQLFPRRASLARITVMPVVMTAPDSRSLSSAEGMNFWPPKPGSTLITSTRSSWSR